MKTRVVPLLLVLGFCHGGNAEPFTNVIDGFTTNITTEFILGAAAPHNFLLITNGGALTNLDRVFIGNTVDAPNNNAVVSGAGSVWHLDDTSYLGLHSASNTLSVLRGANVRAAQVLAVGLNATASNNLLRVAGIDTRLTGRTLHFGTYGAGNQFVVEDSANAEFGTVIFNTEGRTNGGRQAAIVRGVGTQLSITNLLQIGNSPSNALWVSEGARLVTQSSIIGQNASDDNQVVVSGAESQWLNMSNIVVGRGFNSNQMIIVHDMGEVQTAELVVGEGRLVLGEGNSSEHEVIVGDGGILTTSRLRVGAGVNATRNRLEVIGADSELWTSAAFIVGDWGSGNVFLLNDGSYARSVDVGLGMQYTSSNNQAIATGTNTVWVARGLAIGSAGDFNMLSIEEGANVFASSLLSGGQGGFGNLTLVSGAGSLLRLTNELDISNDNTLVVTNRARVESGNGVVGSYNSGSAGLIDNSSWSNAHSLTVGWQGSDNFLRVLNNGRLCSSNGVIGAAENADRNRLEVSGKGTAWRLVGDLSVGSWGDTNELDVSSGATISAKNLNVGSYLVAGATAILPSDANVVGIRGANTVVNVASNIALGYSGSGNGLELLAGAQLTSSGAEVATRTGSVGNTILVSDLGTRWHNTNTLLLGSNGYRSSLVLSNGARLTTGSTILGDGGFQVAVGGGICTNRFGFNSVVATGTATVWEVGQQLIIGRNSTSNYVTITDGATLRAHEIMPGFFGAACLPQEYENVFVLDGGNLVVSNRVFVGPRGRFRMLDGRADVESFWVETGLPAQRAQVLGGTLRPRSMYASAPAQIEIGDGIRRATLELLGGSYFSSGRIIVASNSVVAGRGSINATNAGTYGTLRAITAITNSSLQGSSGFDVWIAQTGPGTGHSLLNVGPTFGPPAILEGRLRVALSPSFQPQASNEFPIVVFTSATGEFSNAPDNSRIKTVDNLNSFLVRYTPTAVILSDHRSTDLDGDLIEDAWATNYFGHSPLAPVERLSDSDGDGMSNYDEFRAGTDPTDAASALRVSATIAQGRATLRWRCMDGKTYRIYFSSDMRTWREVSDPTFAFPEAGICQWMNDAGSSAGQMRFYRVAVE